MADITMKTPQVYEFSLKDCDGKEHLYVGTLHDAMGDGMRIIEGLLAMGIGPVLSFIAKGLAAQAQNGGKATPESLATLDLGTIDVASLQKELQRGALRELAPLLLRRLTRDGQKLEGPALQVYNGNYAEMAEAVKAVIEVNHFFQVLSTFFGGESE